MNQGQRPWFRTYLVPLLLGFLFVPVTIAAQTRKSAIQNQPLTILFHSDPARSDFEEKTHPLSVGDNKIDVMVKGASNKRIDDADVEIRLAPSPTSKTTQITTVPLEHYGDGIYKGTAHVDAAGPWVATIVVKRAGRQVATRRLTVNATTASSP